MGSSQSGPREIVIDNPDETSILEISQNVIDRWKQDQNVNVNGIMEPQRTIYVTSHQINKDIEREITKNNKSWENRLNRLQQGYNNIDKEFEQEYENAVVDAEIFFSKVALKKMEDSCLHNKESIIGCFKKNKSQSLLCRNEVEAFNKCVSSSVKLLLKS